MLPVMILSFGYVIVRLVLQLLALAARGERTNEVAVRHLFTTFAATGSAHATVKAFNQEQPLPATHPRRRA